MNQKGQAAVTDALYFLLIVTFLSVFLFGFANSYGNSVRELITDEYNSTFATNALKSILYASTPRDPDYDVFDDEAEIDYLLAILKEDYADDQEIDLIERKVLGKTILSIMSPVGDTFDYIFTIQTSGESKEFVYIFIHITNFTKERANLVLARDFYTYSAEDDPNTPEDETHVNYFCSIDSEYNNLKSLLTRLRANVGPTSEASAPIKLIRNQFGSNDLENFDAQVDLILWDAVWLGTTEDRTTGLLYVDDPESIENIDWGCEKAELFD
tara:strand:+ start:295 stop:1104 length:810 start_codon:yes stop_codon:yes gene_type:complete